MTMTGWEALVEALREEMQEYGALLNLFDEQQTAILQRLPDVVLTVDGSIHAQLRETRSRRSRREGLVRDTASAMGHAPESSLKTLIECFPENVRPLLKALIEEVNRLITKVKRRAGQNQMLLARSIEVSQEILRRLNPENLTQRYTQNGKLKIGIAGNGSRCLARG